MASLGLDQPVFIVLITELEVDWPWARFMKNNCLLVLGRRIS